MSFDNHINAFVFDANSGLNMSPQQAQHEIEDFIQTTQAKLDQMAKSIARLRSRVSNYTRDMVDVQLIKRDPETGDVSDRTPEDRTLTINNLIESERNLAQEVIIQCTNDINARAGLLYEQLMYTG